MQFYTGSVNLGEPLRLSDGCGGLTRKGAEALKKRLEAYWAERGLGHAVKFTIEPEVWCGERRKAPATLYCVRSNLIGGMPPGEMRA